MMAYSYYDYKIYNTAIQRIDFFIERILFFSDASPHMIQEEQR